MHSSRCNEEAETANISKINVQNHRNRKRQQATASLLMGILRDEIFKNVAVDQNQSVAVECQSANVYMQQARNQ